MRNILNPVRLMTLALALLALISLPFGHRATAQEMTPNMGAFLAMGGTLEDICGESHGSAQAPCDACRIVSAMDLPAPCAQLMPALTPRGMLFGPTAAAQPEAPTPRMTPPARAPPVS